MARITPGCGAPPQGAYAEGVRMVGDRVNDFDYTMDGDVEDQIKVLRPPRHPRGGGARPSARPSGDEPPGS